MQRSMVWTATLSPLRSSQGVRPPGDQEERYIQLIEVDRSQWGQYACALLLGLVIYKQRRSMKRKKKWLPSALVFRHECSHDVGIP